MIFTGRSWGNEFKLAGRLIGWSRFGVRRGPFFRARLIPSLPRDVLWELADCVFEGLMVRAIALS